MKGFKKEDIDIEGQFQYNNFMHLRSSSQLYDQLPCRKKDTKTNYRGYLLKNDANPSKSIRQAYISKALANESKYFKSRFFVELLLSIYLSNQYKNLSKQQLRAQTFGLKPVSNQQNAFFQQVLILKDGIQKGQVKLQQLDRLKIQQHQKWTTIQFQNEYDEKVAEKYMRNYFYCKCTWQPFKKKWEKLQKLQKGLKKWNIRITQRKIIKQSDRRYFHQTMVMIPQKQRQCITLQNLINLKARVTQTQTKISLSNFKIPQASELAYKLFLALNKFKSQFGQAFPCLTPYTILYEVQTGEIILDILALIYFKLGIQQNYVAICDLFSSENIYSSNKQFWKSPTRLKKQNKFDQTNSSELLWQFIFIIDYFEKGNNSYFKNSTNLNDLNKRQINIDQIYSKGDLNKYFGEHSSNILTYLKKQKSMTVNSFCRANNIQDLQAFYSNKAVL